MAMIVHTKGFTAEVTGTVLRPGGTPEKITVTFRLTGPDCDISEFNQQIRKEAVPLLRYTPEDIVSIDDKDICLVTPEMLGNEEVRYK